MIPKPHVELYQSLPVTLAQSKNYSAVSSKPTDIERALTLFIDLVHPGSSMG